MQIKGTTVLPPNSTLLSGDNVLTGSDDQLLAPHHLEIKVHVQLSIPSDTAHCANFKDSCL